MPDKRVARGVWKTDHGWRVHTYKTSPPQSKRLQPTITDPVTGETRTLTLKDVKTWRQAWEADVLRGLTDSVVTHSDAGLPNTFRHDVIATYLRAVKAMPTYKERVRHMMLWVAEFGDLPRRAITPVMIRTVRDRWLTVGPVMVMRPKKIEADAAGNVLRVEPAHYEAVAKPLSASQVTLRMRALENFFTVMDGRHARNPVREVSEPQPNDRPPRALPWPVVEAILDALPDRGRGEERSDGSKTKARLRVIAWTGLSHAQLERLQASDVNLTAATLFRRSRRKGQPDPQGKAKGKIIPLLPQAVAALKEFAALNCWGAFSRASMWKSFQRAAQKINIAGITPYDFRHTFATDTVMAVGDLDLAQELLGHASKTTTAHYAEAAINPLVAAAFARFKKAVRKTRAVTSPGKAARAKTPARSTRKPPTKPPTRSASRVVSNTSGRTRRAF